MGYNDKDRDSGYDPGGCFGTLLAVLVVLAIVVACIIYFGAIILIGFLIIGGIVGLIFALLAYIRSIPKAISDTKYQVFSGSKTVVIVLKKAGYFLARLIAHSMQYDIQYAKESLEKFKLKKFLSFTKWMYLVIAIAAFAGGIIMIGVTFFMCVALILGLIVLAVQLLLLAVAALFIVAVVINIVMAVKAFVGRFKISFTPGGFKFKGKATFKDIGEVPKTYFGNLISLIKTSWPQSGAFAQQMRQNAQFKKWYSPYMIWAIAVSIASPVSTGIVAAVSAIVAVVVFIPMYIVDTVWLLIKSIFKF